MLKPVGEGALHRFLCNIKARPRLPRLSFEEIQIPYGGYIIIRMHRWTEVSVLISKPGCFAGVVESALECQFTF